MSIEQKKKRITLDELLNAIAMAYLLVIFALLPLYMKNGYVRIGDGKYVFYRNTTLFFIVLSLIGLVCYTIKYKDTKEALEVSLIDISVFTYGLFTIFSYLLSDYKEIALWGHFDWHMGLVSQLFFVWSYFFISRFYDGNKKIFIVGACSASVVFFIGVANRYCYDPLLVFRGISHWEWNRLNLLSTIGNINWYCGYLSVGLPGLMYLFWSEKGWRRLIGGIGSILGLLSLFTQGSESGYAALIGILMVLLFCSFTDRNKMKRFLSILIMIPGVCLILRYSIEWMPRGLQLLEDSSSARIIYFRGWFFLLIVLLILQGIASNKLLRYKNMIKCGIVVVLIGGIIFLLLCQVSDTFWGWLGNPSILRIDDNWGNGRGSLWRLSIQGFQKGDAKTKLFGVGPDCFAGYMYEVFDVRHEIHVSGQWADAVFANAHNEWLNMLVNGGILGGVAYVSIFITAFFAFIKEADKELLMVLGGMTIAGYAANNVFSFQQVITTPYMFALIAVVEGVRRKMLMESTNKEV